MIWDEVILPIILAIILLICGVILGGVFILDKYQKEAIKYGCGQYNSTTSHFEWLKKEDN